MAMQYRYMDATIDDMPADLRADAEATVADGAPVQYYTVTIYDEAGVNPASESAKVLHSPDDMRTGIAWGADATWFDSTGDIERDIAMWLNDPDALDARR